jgi:hypothetical protein
MQGGVVPKERDDALRSVLQIAMNSSPPGPERAKKR